MATKTGGLAKQVRRATALLTALMLGATMTFTVAEPAEAAYLSRHPHLVCQRTVNSSIAKLGYVGHVRIHHNLYSSFAFAERGAAAYRVERYSSGAWRLYSSRSMSFTFSIYPASWNYGAILSNEYVERGSYRIVLALSWYQNGSLRNWGGVLGTCTFG